MNDDQQADRIIGTSIADRYLIEEKIGEGGIGSVYRASDRRVMGRKVVVKVLLDDWAEHGDILRKFEHEKEALARLDHPAIVNILDAGTLEGGKSFFVMPFVEGRTLREMLDQDGRPDWAACAHIIESVTDALAAAHSKGILHRDVKPGNIMLSELAGGKLRVLLIDFGIARVTGSETSPLTEVARPLGTVLYAPPEQLEGSTEQTPAADVYSCAVIAYEMLTGHLPFKPTSIYHMLLLQNEGLKILPSALNRDLPVSIDSIIAPALSYDPKARPQQANEFGGPLAIELRRLAAANAVDSGESRITKPRLPLMTDAVADPNTVANAAVDTRPDPARLRVPVEVERAGDGSADAEVATSVRPPVTRSKFVPAVAATALLAMVVLAGAGWLAYKFFGPQAAVPTTRQEQPSTAATNRLQFHLLAKSDGASATARRTDGGEVFTGDTGVAINVVPAGEGYLYLYNEAEAEPGKFNILFPTATQHEGRAQVAAGEQIQTDFNVFEGPPGKDLVWMIWTKNAVPELEAIRERSVAAGTLDDPKLAKWLRDYLAAAAAKTVEATKDDPAQTTLRTTQPQIIHRIEITHK